MNKYILFLMLFPLAVFGQQVTLSGKIADTAKKPVAFTEVALLQPSDSLVVKVVTATEEGTFVLDEIPAGAYLFRVTTIGYDDYYEQIDLQQSLVLPVIVLKQQAEMLDNVEINSKRPIVKRKIDRLEFTVANSILSSSNAWEILKKTPGVIAGGTGAIAVRGSTSILVTINDKKVYLSGEELKQLLENTSGEDIQSVEVITNPPAKYEAQGSAVLNIKMKKNNMRGYKGTASAAYVQSMYPKGIVATSHYYKGEKLSVSGNYSFGSGTYYRQGEDVVYYLNAEGQPDSEWKSIMNRKNKALAQNNYRLNLTYEIDSLNTVSLGGNGFVSQNNHGNYNVPTVIYNASQQIDSMFVTRNSRYNPQRNNSFNASYEHVFAPKEKININSDYTRYNRSENQDISSDFSLPDSAPYRTTRFLSENTNKIRLFSVQADYSREKEGIFEAGVKFGTVKANSSLDYRDDIDGALVLNPQRTNRFLYDESIFAGYGSYSREWGKWSFKAGLRGEYTQLEGNSKTNNETNTQHYFKLFPTLYGMYKISEGNDLGISYGKRISRPQYSWLNPFRSYYNSYSYFTGDPKLQPAIIHNISMLYTLKSKYNFDLYYRNEKNPSMEISYQDYATNTVVYHYTNIDKNSAYGLDFNTNLELFAWWDSGIQGAVSYQKDQFQGIDGGLYTNARWTYNGSVNNRFTLNKAAGLTAEVNFYYASPAVQGTFTISSTSSLGASLRKVVLKGKGEFSMILSDLYRGEKQKVTTNYANQYNYFYDYSDTRSIRLAFKYNFGNQTLKGQQTKGKTEEQQRL